MSDRVFLIIGGSSGFGVEKARALHALVLLTAVVGLFRGAQNS